MRPSTHVATAPSKVTSPPTDVSKIVDPLFERICGRFDELESKLEALRSLLTTRRKDYLTVEEVADLVGRSAFTVRRWITEKKLTAIRVDGTGPRGRLLIPATELERLVADGRGTNMPDAMVK